MKRSLLLLLPVLLLASGCAQFQNRLTCTVARDKAFFVSQYYRVGVASEISEVDTKVLCSKP